MVRPRAPLWLGALVLLGGLAMLVERGIVTDEEAIEALVKRAAGAVMAGDFDAFADTLDPEYEADGRDRHRTVAWVRRLWRRHRPVGLEVDVSSIEVHGDHAQAHAEARLSVLGRPVYLELALSFRRRGEAPWRVTSARLSGWRP